jgi:hypothetical protein
VFGITANGTAKLMQGAWISDAALKGATIHGATRAAHWSHDKCENVAPKTLEFEVE